MFSDGIIHQYTHTHPTRLARARDIVIVSQCIPMPDAGRLSMGMARYNLGARERQNERGGGAGHRPARTWSRGRGGKVGQSRGARARAAVTSHAESKWLPRAPSSSCAAAALYARSHTALDFFFFFFFMCIPSRELVFFSVVARYCGDGCWRLFYSMIFLSFGGSII